MVWNAGLIEAKGPSVNKGKKASAGLPDGRGIGQVKRSVWSNSGGEMAIRRTGACCAAWKRGEA